MLLLNIRYIMEVKLFDFNVYTGKRGGESGSDVYAKSFGLGTDFTLKYSPKLVGLMLPIEFAN